MSQEIRIGVIGAGGRGDIVRYAHDPEHGVCVVAAADPNPEALQAFRVRYGANAYVTDGCHQNYTVIGTEGRIENFGDFTGDVIVRLWNKPPNYNPDGDEQFRVSNGPAAEHGGADPRIVGEFVRLLREDGAAASATPIEARDSVAAGYAATESLRHGGIPMDVPTYQPSNSTPR